MRGTRNVKAVEQPLFSCGGGLQTKLVVAADGFEPAALSAALTIARKDFETWPKLLPIFGHRFLAAEPCRRGNPIFSIMQTDIICYGANLAHYLMLEFIDSDYALQTHAQNIQRIDIWSDLAS